MHQPGSSSGDLTDGLRVEGKEARFEKRRKMYASRGPNGPPFASPA